MIRSLQTLRAVGALIIFTGHFAPFASEGWDMAADMCIALFFIVSGFVLSLAHHESIVCNTFSARRFMLKRLQRIYPLYICCIVAWLLAVALIHIDPWPSPALVATHLLMLQSWVPDIHVYHGMNGVAWFVSTLMPIYGVFYLLSRGAHGAPRIFWPVYVLASLCWIACMHLIPEGLQSWAVNVCPAARMLDFTLGIALYHIYRRLREHPLSTHSLVWLWIATLLITALSAVLAPCIGRTYTGAVWWWPAVSLLLIACGLSEGRLRPFDAVMCSDMCVRAGDMSFAFYMVHGIVIAVCASLFAHLWPVAPVAVQYAMALAVSVAVGAVAHRYVPKLTHPHHK